MAELKAGEVASDFETVNDKGEVVKLSTFRGKRVDQHKSITQKYGAWGEREFAGRKFMGDIRSHFVIDENRKIVDVQYGVRPNDSVTLSIAQL